MNPTDPSSEKGKSRQPKPPSTPSEPDAPASKSLAPWELAGQMNKEQIKSFADALVKLWREKQARAAQPPPATSSAVDKPKMTDE